MSAQITTVVFVLGVVLLLVFVVVGLASPRLRRRLQEPADRMVDADRDRWGPPAARPHPSPGTAGPDQHAREEDR